MVWVVRFHGCLQSEVEPNPYRISPLALQTQPDAKLIVLRVRYLRSGMVFWKATRVLNTRCEHSSTTEATMGTILIIILILLLIGALPTWPYSTGWGYYPSGGLGLILVIIIVLALMGRF